MTASRGAGANRRTTGLVALTLTAALALAGCGNPASPAGVRAASALAGIGRQHAEADRVPPPAPTVLENSRPGALGWRITPATGDRQVGSISGYTDRSSVLPGTPVGLDVSTAAASWSAVDYRMGWYAGRKARKVWSVGAEPGHLQPPGALDPTTRTTVAHRTRTLLVPTTAWPAGQYMIRLTSSTGAQSYVPLMVRSASTAGKLVLVAATMTGQAYNDCGGFDLFRGPGAHHGHATRSLAVSFDRPYSQSYGAGLFFDYLQPVLAQAERLGLPLAYETDVDISTHPGLLAGARAVVFGGHAEYWTEQLRAAVLAARDAGTNVAFLGANTEYWRVDLASSPVGPNRLVVGYKTAANPVATSDSGLATTRFRDPPNPQPENTLVGMRYECFPAQGAYRVVDPGFWLFAGTGVSAGTGFPGLAGPEIDRYYPLPGTPHPIQIVADSQLTCRGVGTWQDSAYYTTPSGAGVFATGTMMRWVCALAGGCRQYGVTAAATAFVTTVTDHLLTAFSLGTVGPAHPALDNSAAYAGRPAVNRTGAS